MNIINIPKQEEKSRTAILNFDGESSGLYIEYGDCLMLSKLLSDVLLEDSLLDMPKRKKYEYFSYLKHIINKHIDKQ